LRGLTFNFEGPSPSPRLATFLHPVQAESNCERPRKFSTGTQGSCRWYAGAAS